MFGIALAIIGLIVWLVRLESKADNSKEMIKALEIAYQLKIKEIEADHERERTILWAKIDEVQKSINTLLTEVGRVQGRLDANASRM